MTDKKDKWNIAFDIIIDSIATLIKRPSLILPILTTWIIYAAEIVYFKFYFNWEPYTLKQLILIVFLIIFSFCFLFSISTFVMLEIIQQIESGRKTNIFKAIGETFIKDIPKAFPIMLVWAILWFILTLLEALTKNKKENDDEVTLKNIANTFVNYNNFSIFSLSLDLINSGIRLIVFFIYPAIAWEDENCIDAIKKGFAGIKRHLSEFLSGFLSTELASVIIFMPISIFMYTVIKLDIELPNAIWCIVIILIAIATSFYLYLQQMFAALLYMWNMKWLKECYSRIGADESIPKLQDVKKPYLLDNEPDLL